ncbi:longevity assurance proteins LAG1/LAC1 [Backusella circina FSU 941]|nr:longevity assurance proteins LAG1/LAC1 [Backusella circina FSU 941]
MKKSMVKNSRKMKQKSSTMKELALYLSHHQIEFPLRIIMVIVAGYLLRLPYFKNFIFIANQRSDGRYEKSIWDITFLLFYVCVFTALRAAVMDYLLVPLAKSVHVEKKKWSRFAEQSWMALYYSVFFIFGFHIIYHSPWWFDSSYFWRDYPVTDYSTEFKYYYLLQFAFWLQQIFVLQIEAPRKDYRELVLHHINTLLLISLSYGCNFTRVGNAVFLCMDLPDIFLALAKALNYSFPGIACNTVFGISLVSWLYTRIYIYGGIILSTLTEPELYVPEFKLDPVSGNWFPHFVKYIIAGLMIGLYILILFWTVMFFKVLYKILFTDDVKDIRSDDEEETEEVSIEKIEGDHSQKKAKLQ